MLWRIASLLALVPLAASGNLMTFEGLPTNGQQLAGTYIEDGIIATGSLGEWHTVDAAHVDRLGTPFESAIEFSMGSAFIADSVMIRPGGSEYCAADCDNIPRSEWDDPIPYIWFSGFLDGTLVDSIGVFRPASSEFETFVLSMLGPLDLLRIEVRNYIDLGLRDPGDVGAPDRCNIGACGHFDVDNVRLTPVQSVPEPGTLLLFAGAFAGAGLIRRRGRA